MLKCNIMIEYSVDTNNRSPGLLNRYDIAVSPYRDIWVCLC